jgi:HrpA-like RNA helicase
MLILVAKVVSLEAISCPTSAGTSVGYRIRLDATATPRTPLQFVTCGVLVRLPTAPGAGGVPSELAHVTHVILDEIHERDQFADFAIVLLLGVLKQRPDLKLILMSATLQTRLLSDFFGGCPVLEVPGRMFPVEDRYFDDVVEAIGGLDKHVRAALGQCSEAALCRTRICMRWQSQNAALSQCASCEQ